MADKEATVYIVDVGSSMGKKRNGREETDLDWAMQYVWDKITSTVRAPLDSETIIPDIIRKGLYGAENSHHWRGRFTNRWYWPFKQNHVTF